MPNTRYYKNHKNACKCKNKHGNHNKEQHIEQHHHHHKHHHHKQHHHKQHHHNKHHHHHKKIHARISNDYQKKSLVHIQPYTVHTMNVNPTAITTSSRLYNQGFLSSSFLELWSNGRTGNGIKIAIVDTGILSSHPSLQGKVVQSINLTNEPNIVRAHGTHVAGIICADGWLLGAAVNARLIDIKIITTDGGTVSNMIKAIIMAADNGAHIINMSIGVTTISATEKSSLAAAVQYAWNKGTICISAAGNDGTSLNTVDAYSYPASMDNVISVGATSVGPSLNDMALATFSTENNEVTLTACGVNIISTVLNNQYGVFSGTSTAAPFVSAMAALCAEDLLSSNPNLSGIGFSQQLQQSLFTKILPLCPNSNKCVIPNSSIGFGKGYLRNSPNKDPSRPANTHIYNFNSPATGTLFLGYST